MHQLCSVMRQSWETPRSLEQDWPGAGLTDWIVKTSWWCWQSVVTRIPRQRGGNTDLLAHQSTLIYWCWKLKSKILAPAEAVFPGNWEVFVLDIFRLYFMWSRQMQLPVQPGLPACCFDLFTSGSRSALLDTTDLPLLYTNLRHHIQYLVWISVIIYYAIKSQHKQRQLWLYGIIWISDQSVLSGCQVRSDQQNWSWDELVFRNLLKRSK